MECTHAKTLIPLYVSDDLTVAETIATRQHLAACESCRVLASEFEESRDWLGGFTPLAFDEVAINDLRDSVLSQIGRIESRRKWRQWIIPGWNLRFAASMAMTVLITVFAIYAYLDSQSRRDIDKKFAVKKQNKDRDIKENGPIKNAAHNSERNKFPLSPLPIPRAPQGGRKGIVETQLIKAVQLPDQRQETVAIVPTQVKIEPMVEPPPASSTINSDVAEMREMTRIEFQTADPNIRIIWLTPKDSNGSTPKPNTNAR